MNEEMKSVEKDSNRFNWLMTLLVLVILAIMCFFPAFAHAQVTELQKDVPHQGTVYVCRTMEDANDVSTTHATEGIAVAMLLFRQKHVEDKCAVGMVPFIPRKVASTAKGSHGTVYVLEIELPDGGTVFMLSEYPIVKKMEHTI